MGGGMDYVDFFIAHISLGLDTYMSLMHSIL